MSVDDDVEIMLDVEETGGDGGGDETENEESGDGRVGEGHGGDGDRWWKVAGGYRNMLREKMRPYPGVQQDN